MLREQNEDGERGKVGSDKSYWVYVAQERGWMTVTVGSEVFEKGGYHCFEERGV